MEATALPMPYSNVVFFRGNGLHTLNSTVDLPSAGSSVAVTDGATLVVNSTGNIWKSTNALFGVMRIGANDAVPTTARLVVGQGGDQAITFDLNGYNQTVAGLEWGAPTGNLLTKGISNSNATTTSTFTVNQATAPTATNFNGTISGKVNFVKEGAAAVSLTAPASTFTGNVTINAGTLSATGVGANNGANGTLGAANVAGRTITVNNTATLNLLSNNIFGNGVGNANLPATIINAGGTVSSTNYNSLGDVTLNGGLLTQASTAGPGIYEGYQFLGSITAGGTAASTISTTNGKANHLGANTTIDVSNATNDSLPDLIISAPLKNQSGDFANAAGGFTKTGTGTLQLTADNTFTGTATISAGTVALNGTGAIADTSNVNLSGATGTLDISGITAGSETIGNLNGVSGSSVLLDSKTLIYGGDNLPSTFAGVASGTGGLTKAGTSTSTLSGTNTYTGATSVTGGTLMLGADNVLPNSAALNLSSGTTLATGGFSDSTGLLSLNTSATIDMGANVAGSVLTFGDVTTWSGILNVWNYTGAPWVAGTDKLIFSSNIGNIDLGKVNFYSDNGITPMGTTFGATIVNGTELVPVPEPTAIASILALLGLAGYKERRRFLHFRK